MFTENIVSIRASNVINQCLNTQLANIDVSKFAKRTVNRATKRLQETIAQTVARGSQRSDSNRRVAIDTRTTLVMNLRGKHAD